MPSSPILTLSAPSSRPVLHALAQSRLALITPPMPS
jgi:hypothetical protein